MRSKHFLLADHVIVVIGGNTDPRHSAYQSPGKIAASLSRSADKKKCDKRIGIGHIVDYFMMADVADAGAQVYHVPAIDAQQSKAEARLSSHRTGVCLDVTDAELDLRVRELFQEATYRNADAIGTFKVLALSRETLGTVLIGAHQYAVLDYDIALPVPAEASLDAPQLYLVRRAFRAFRVMQAVGRGWKTSMPKLRRVIVLLNSLWGVLLPSKLGSCITDCQTMENERKLVCLPRWSLTSLASSGSVRKGCADLSCPAVPTVCNTLRYQALLQSNTHHDKPNRAARGMEARHEYFSPLRSYEQYQTQNRCLAPQGRRGLWGHQS